MNNGGQENFKTQVSEQLGISEDQVVVNKVTAGSTIIDYTILPSEELTVEDDLSSDQDDTNQEL